MQRTGVTQVEVDEALERLRTVPEAAGLMDRLLIVGNRQELDGKYGRPGEADYHADEWAGIKTAEGYHDPDTGGTVVLRDQVEVREGETPAVAVARVVMHERVGHGGVNALLGTEPKFQKKWDKASALIPAAELQSLRQKYPELTDRPADLALEWLAHQTGDRMSSQSFKPGSAAAEMWQTLKDYVAKIMHAASGGKMMSDAALDAYVREMIAGARRKVKNGEAGGGGKAIGTMTMGASRDRDVPAIGAGPNETEPDGRKLLFSPGEKPSSDKGNSMSDRSRSGLSHEKSDSKVSKPKQDEAEDLSTGNQEKPNDEDRRNAQYESAIIEVVDRDGNEVVGKIAVSKGEARFIFTAQFEEDAFVMAGAHIEGDASMSEVVEVAKALGREAGKKYVVIQGGRRTTGAKAGRGLRHTPRPIKLKTGL